MIARKNCVEFREFLETGVISPERMRAVDANAQALGVSALQLMESAAKSRISALPLPLKIASVTICLLSLISI